MVGMVTEKLMSALHNPYAQALDGLKLDDPVAAFFAFCRAREDIRIRRERGDPSPWSSDPIFQQGRFLNVFREDDRGSKAILRLASGLASDLPGLVQAVFFGRWCNKQSVLDSLDSALLDDSAALREALQLSRDQPWCNITAYPVGPVQWEGQTHSRFDAATVLFGQIKNDLATLIEAASGDVVKATHAINECFEMDNDFPVFMAVMDLAWFRPDIVDPLSPVPTGIGAVAFLDRLQHHLGLSTHDQTCQEMMRLQGEYWPDAKRQLAPIDIEYLSCECRKYYSYVNGTKAFEGKNVFHPGREGCITFDVAPQQRAVAPLQTQIHVLAGGPCSGKTTLLRALEEAGLEVQPETARTMIEDGEAEGRSAADLRADPVAWQLEVLSRDYSIFDAMSPDRTVFTDTSFIEDLVFAERAGIKLGENIQAWLKHRRYQRVFFLEPIADHEQNDSRLESASVSRRIGELVHDQYCAHGYSPVVIPAVSVQERVSLIMSHLESENS